jgi:hypothetical protein
MARKMKGRAKSDRKKYGNGTEREKEKEVGWKEGEPGKTNSEDKDKETK